MELLEKISKVEVLESGEASVVLVSGGRADYQMIYREAAEVYWDNERKGFMMPPPRSWSYIDSFRHLLKVTKNFGIQLVMTEKTEWINVPEGLQALFDDVSKL